MTCSRAQTQHLPLRQPLWLVAARSRPISAELLADRNLGQANILHHRPDDGEATRLGRERVDLIGALAHITKQAFDGIGAANVTVHDRREGIKRQQMLFIFAEAADCFGIALLIFGECSPPD